MKAEEHLQDTMTAGQVARELGVSQTRIAELARKGRLEFVQTPLGRLFHRRSVEQVRQERDDRVRQAADARTASRKPPVALGIQWEDIERRLIDGMSMRDIASELGCSVQNVHERVQRRRRDLQRAEKSGTDAQTSVPTAATTGSRNPS